MKRKSKQIQAPNKQKKIKISDTNFEISQNSKKEKNILNDSDNSHSDSEHSCSSISSQKNNKTKNNNLTNKKITTTSISDLMENIKLNTKSYYQAKKDENQKLYKTIANYGIKSGYCATMNRNGEYYGLTIELLEEIHPLYTDNRIFEALKFIESENLISCINYLNLQEESKKYGITIVYEIIRIWLLKQNIYPPPNFGKLDLDPEIIENLKKKIEINRHDPLNSKFRIVSLGESKKGHSVVPEEWLGKEFNNGEEMHRAMDELDWRKGKPPVKFCITYGLSLIEENKWIQKDKMTEFELENFINRYKNNQCLMVSLTMNEEFRITSDFLMVSDILERKKWINKLPEQISLISSNKTEQPIIIATELSKFFEEQNHFEKNENVGVLVSRLQKSIRRGEGASLLLYETMKKLRLSSGYNLPEQQFIRVSSNCQLFWRLFISCIEDSYLYIQTTNNEKYLGLLDLCIFSLICSIDNDLQIKESIMYKAIITGLLIQSYKKSEWDWRKGKEHEIKELKFRINQDYSLFNTMIFSIKTQHMMSGDRTMILKIIDLLKNKSDKEFKSFEIDIKDRNSNEEIIDYLLKNKNNEIYNETLISSLDMHCYPNIILILQGTIPFLPDLNYQTKNISHLIWDLSSSYNIRYTKEKNQIEKHVKLIKSLREIQSFLTFNEINDKKFILKDEFLKNKKYKKLIDEIIISNSLPEIEYKNIKLSENESRIAFLNLFGRKIKLNPINKSHKCLDAILCGTELEPVKIKSLNSNKMVYLEGNERIEGEERFKKEFSIKNKYYVENPLPPLGYNWIFNEKTKIEITCKIENNKIIPMCDNIELELFNSERVLQHHGEYKLTKNFPLIINSIIKRILYQNVKELEEYSDFELNLLLRTLGQIRVIKKDFRLFDCEKIFFDIGISKLLWKHVLIKLFNGNNNEILIGPVDRSGKKLQNSISYQFEGVLWRIYNLLMFLFPGTIQISSDLKFKSNQSDINFPVLIRFLINLSKESDSKTINNIKININPPSIVTKLWDHQISTVDRMFHGFVNLRKRGFGDASCVGSGKTLTALSLIQRLINYNIQSNNYNYKGILILLPTTNLFKTWLDEIKKHSKGFIFCTQMANGELDPKNCLINTNTLVISTLGRFREHPLFYSWQLVVIDECLSVQNREALQTEEAWKQVILSQFGVIMMSATFFRSRFDKMFFMLKMLRSGIPEEKEYLDCILNESMICHIAEKSRKWVTNINRLKMSDELRKKYNEIKTKDMSLEHLYKALEQFLLNNFDLVSNLKKLIKQIEIQGNHSILIYAKSKAEADNIEKIENVSRFPDLTKKHVVVAYSEGTYGLNDLVKYNCILTRPPEPDKLPQMKGRLDRPGQNKDILGLEYFIIEDTIEEGLITRLEIANRFINNYLMPLAQFYEISIGKKN